MGTQNTPGAPRLFYISDLLNLCLTHTDKYCIMNIDRNRTAPNAWKRTGLFSTPRDQRHAGHLYYTTDARPAQA